MKDKKNGSSKLLLTLECNLVTMNNQQGVLYLINPVIHQLSEGMNDQRKNKEQLR